MNTTDQTSPAPDPEEHVPPSNGKAADGSDADATSPVAPTEDPPPEADFA